MVFSKLLVSLISPLGTALLLGGLALALRARRRLATGLALVAVVWLYVWSTPLASNALRASLEDRWPALSPADLPKEQAIVVLGGAISPGGGNGPNLLGAADRIWFAARLYHAGKAPLLLLSGGSDPVVSRMSEAEAMRVFLRDLGVPDSAMLLEGESRTTRENARFSARLLRERGIRRILLVTSALHMARARALFAAQGLATIPAATDYETGSVNWALRGWLPDAAALDGSARAMKEIVGRWAGV